MSKANKDQDEEENEPKPGDTRKEGKCSHCGAELVSEYKQLGRESGMYWWVQKPHSCIEELDKRLAKTESKG